MARRASREYEFIPRIINPVKIKRAYFFAADAQVRESRKVLDQKMPWLSTEVLPDPQSVLVAASGEPSVFLFDDTGLAILDAKKLHARSQDSIFVLLSFQPYIQYAPPQAAWQKYPYAAGADLVFAVNRDAFPPESIVLPAVRAAEDLLNIKKHSSLRRFIFHIVDDEPRWFSQFLPVLYAIIGQRADVMITRTYEESLSFLFGVEEESKISAESRLPRGHGDDVVCLITDIFFPKGNELQSGAGRDLIRLVNKHFPRIPVIIASKAKEAHELQGLGFVLPKGDPGSLEKLKAYILNFTGMGDFFLSDDDGRELRRARNIREICGILLDAEKDTEEARRLRQMLENYGDKDKFSTWLYMHSYRELGDRLRPRRSRGRALITLLKRNLQVEIARLDRTPLAMGGKKVFNLPDLLAALRSLAPEKIQPYSDNDIISSWLDRRGCPELAEELRPIHGSGTELRQSLVEIVDKWITVYRERDSPL
ncbi:MAG TPA: hypothetical protein VMW46_07000 [Candidatus Desulfaltia sp.]|nr:hypothetical protein [Candidatus Desulfaltia sp.]